MPLWWESLAWTEVVTVFLASPRDPESSICGARRSGSLRLGFPTPELLKGIMFPRLNCMQADQKVSCFGKLRSINMEEYNKSSVKKARLNSLLTTLLDDPILSDVPKNPTFADVDTLINLELGSAMRISVLKLDGTTLDVIVMNSATVKDLKLAIKKKVNDMEQSSMGHRHISWKHVWANYCLSCHNNKLLDDNEALQNFGVRNNSQVQFVSYVMTKESRRHSKRRKHRFFHGLNKRS
ncbi:U11/U12 small nuclear ribonucleoprotein 25 kDa protein isoform E [Glycine soja]|uniref:U11/U12 small nuclear ribonucleoprotein 25 kDa protein isoform E n=2 Tax=Glycine soja TaxID=3848 RepID=A0A445HZI2_GLYSO|nr:U11/U12 small nuclear ribonucleoprotein 25 kDa protein isoform E [Glycine soja]